MSSCSIIIPVHNRAALTQQCLTSVLAHTASSVKSTIVVVDDASDDATARILSAYGDRLRVITQKDNGGFATACNDGTTATDDQFLVFLHNDTLPEPGWLDALIAYAEAHPEAAVIGSKLISSSGNIQHAGIVIGQDGQPRYLYAGFPAEHPAVDTSRRFQMVATACALVRRSAFERAGGFDTTYRLNTADLDLCLRIAALGHEIHYCHESVLHHLGRLDMAFEGMEPGSHADRDAQLFRTRWGHRLQPDDMKYYIEDELLSIDYAAGYPLQVTASPMIATFDGSGRAWLADQLLHARTQQVAEMSREHTRLILRIDEQERDIQALARQLAEQRTAALVNQAAGRSS